MSMMVIIDMLVTIVMIVIKVLMVIIVMLVLVVIVNLPHIAAEAGLVPCAIKKIKKRWGRVGIIITVTLQ